MVSDLYITYIPSILSKTIFLEYNLFSMKEFASNIGRILSERGVSLNVEGQFVRQIAAYTDYEYGGGEQLIMDNNPMLVIGTDPKLSLPTHIKERNPQKPIDVVESDKKRSVAAQDRNQYGDVIIYHGSYPDDVDQLVYHNRYSLVVFKHGLNYVDPDELRTFINTARFNLREGGLFIASVTGVFKTDQHVREALQKHHITDFKTEPFKGTFGGTVFVFNLPGVK